MPEYTNLQIAVLTMPKDDLGQAAGIITDWTVRLLNGWFEDYETGEDRHYEMPADLAPHVEVLGGMRERVTELLDAIDNFAGYFPAEEDVRDSDFVVEFYESGAFENAPTISVTVDVDSIDAVVDAARVIDEWSVLMLQAKDELPAEIVPVAPIPVGPELLGRGSDRRPVWRTGTLRCRVPVGDWSRPSSPSEDWRVIADEAMW